MDWQEQIVSLEQSGKVLCDLFQDVDEAQVRWKPAPEKWSMLEVLLHLWDEEREDFRRRLSLTLEDPAEDWPPIDPVGWVGERRYNERDLVEALEGFARARAASLAYLRGLDAPDWDRRHVHPRMGAIRAGDLLAAWTAHDWLHVRQLANLRALYLAVSSAPYSTRYAAP